VTSAARPRSVSGRARAAAGLACAALAVAALGVVSPSAALAEKRAASFKLDNGVEVIVIPDHRAPLVNHSVWYRAGGADEPRGVSGIAHFLEHLMFKGTSKYPPGALDKAISRNGGQNNAETSSDYTRYHEQIAKKHLGLIMDLEADRMTNLRLDEPDVLTERKVILEERRSTVDNNPSTILVERMTAALYLAHPYRIPVLGWENEMKTLSREDALTFYKRFYAPANALVVVSGDVTPEEVLKLANETYGKIPAGPALAPRKRVAEPEPAAQRRVTLTDARAGKATLMRMYLTSSAAKSQGHEDDALTLLTSIIGKNSVGRLYKKLVVEDRLAASASAAYSGLQLDSGALSLSAVASDGVQLEKIEAAIDAVIAEVRANGVTEKELEQARKVALAHLVYEADDVAEVAQSYGAMLTSGLTIEQAEHRSDGLAAVTREDVQAAARKYLDPKRSVTGYLIPAETRLADQTPGGKE
jgi:zinc protease